ncbi:dystrophin-like [Tubulanus polymorphus]|uniref:dystrophin-like n=1 Tax=Tubulanus polymorphus TaxID=672921 RepID=UPI003DA3844B
MELMKHQASVANVLHEGNQLIQDSKISHDEEAEIQIQMALLNNRWEELRIKAMEKQSKLQHTLMDLQQRQLDSLDQWLTKMEVHIVEAETIGSDLQALKLQTDQHKIIQDELIEQQDRVNNLQNMVVVVDDSNSEKDYGDFEGQLERLGTRWSSVCQWTEDRWTLLQELLGKWQQYDSELQSFNEWLTAKEQMLAEMKSDDLGDPAQVVSQLKKLKSAEESMDIQLKKFDLINQHCQDMVEILNHNEQFVVKFNATMEDLQGRWEALVHHMGYQSQRIAQSHIHLSELAAQTKTVVTADESNQSTHPNRENHLRGELEIEIGEIKEWLDKTESNLELLTSEAPNPEDQLTFDEQMVLIEDIENEITMQQSKFDALEKKWSNLLAENALDEEANNVLVAKMAEVSERWSQVCSLFDNTHKKVETNIRSSKVFEDLIQLKEVLLNYQKWIDTAESGIVGEDYASEITAKLENCKDKLKSMKSHEEQVDQIRMQVKELPDTADNLGQLQDDLHLFLQEWEAVFNKIGSYQESLLQSIDETPSSAFNEAVDAFHTWLTDIEAVLDSESFEVNDIDILEAQYKQYKELQDDISEHVSTVDYIKSITEEMIQRATFPEKKDRFTSDLEKIEKRWLNVNTTIDERMTKFQTAIQNLEKLQSQTVGLLQWMDEMDMFLHAAEVSYGDNETIQAQLQESDGVQEDIVQLQKNVDNIKELMSELVSSGNKQFIEQLDEDVSQLYSQWEEVVSLAKKQNHKLRMALEKTEMLQQEICALDKWLDSFLQIQLSKEYVVEDSHDLGINSKAMKKLKVEVSAKDNEMKSIQKIYGSMLADTVMATHKDLDQRMSSIKDKWADVCTQVEELFDRYVTGEGEWLEFKNLLSKEVAWVSRVQRILHIHRNSNSVDAEEVSEELDELENLVIHNHTDENKLRMEELVGFLVAKKVMVGTIKKEWESFLNKWNSTNSEGHKRITYLDSTMKTSQNIERQLIEMSQWTNDVALSLREWLDADFLAADFPDVTETLLREFTHQEKILSDLNAQVATYQQEGKAEASTRLQQQINIASKHFSEVKGMFNKFQRPANFDLKLNFVRRTLNDIEERLHFIDLIDTDPENVETQLQHCLTFYHSMSELKPDVEYVIKTGRQIVDKQQVDFPEKLNQQIEAIKQHYNKLGIQVTQGKADLENAVQLSKFMHADIIVISNVLNRWEKVLQREEKLSIVEDADKDVAKHQPHIESLSSTFNKLQEMADESGLVESQEQVGDIKRRWASLVNLVQSKKTSLQGKTSDDDDYSLDSLDIEMENFMKASSSFKQTLHITSIEEENLPSEVVKNQTLLNEEKERLEGEMQRITEKVKKGLPENSEDIAIDGRNWFY